MVMFSFYIIILATLGVGFTKILQKYINPLTSRNDDYYLLLAIFGTMCNYFCQLVSIIMVYNMGAIFCAHIMKICSFWAYTTFTISQVYFKDVRLFRLFKILFSSTFFALAGTIGAFVIGGNTVIITGMTSYVMASMLMNVVADAIVDIACLGSSIIMLIVAPRVSLGPKPILLTGVSFSVICYSVFLINTLMFSSTNIILYTIANITGMISAALIVIVVVNYYLKVKKNIKQVIEISSS